MDCMLCVEELPRVVEDDEENLVHLVARSVVLAFTSFNLFFSSCLRHWV